MIKYINALTVASVIIILAMGTADFMMSQRIDLVRLSASACAPILSLALYRLATRPASRAVVKRK